MPDDLIIDFVFVPNGAPWPADWVRRHPDYITLPARFKGTPEQMRRMFGKYLPAPAQTFFQKTPSGVDPIGDGGGESAGGEGAGSRESALSTPKPTGLSAAAGDVVAAWTAGSVNHQQLDVPDPAPQLIRDAVVRGLDLIEPGRDHTADVRPYSDEFAQIVDPTQVFMEGWEKKAASHALYGLESAIPGHPDYVVKFYPDDLHGPNMVVITRPTGSYAHKIDALAWIFGFFPNTILSHEFCVAASGCGPDPRARSSK